MTERQPSAGGKSGDSEPVRRIFARPTTQRQSVRFVKDDSQARFERESLGGALWFRPCRSSVFLSSAMQSSPAAGTELESSKHDTKTKDRNEEGEEEKEEEKNRRKESSLFETVPDEFATAEDYIAFFDPLVLEEARESIRSEYFERCGEGSTVRPAEVLSIQDGRSGGGWKTLMIRVGGSNSHQALQTFRKRMVVVLTLGRPPSRNVEEWVKNIADDKIECQTNGNTSGVEHDMHVILGDDLKDMRSSGYTNKMEALYTTDKTLRGNSNTKFSSKQEDKVSGNLSSQDTFGTSSAQDKTLGKRKGKSTKNDGSLGCIVAGIVNRTNVGSQGLEIEIRIHPICEQHKSQVSTSCAQEYETHHSSDTSSGKLQKSKQTTNLYASDFRDSKGYLPCCALVYETLQKFQQGWWIAPAGMLITSEREFKAVHAVRNLDTNLLKYILAPSRLADIGKYYSNDDVRRSMWPHHARQPPFIDYLKRNYDYRQLEAIEMTACHLGSPPGSSEYQSYPTLPFVLIQGPPGTGKTHTVVGVLNVWHLTAYQRYYDRLVQQAQGIQIEQGTPSASSRAPPIPRDQSRFNPLGVLNAGLSADIDMFNNRINPRRLSTSFDIVLATKPRILVCAPSNAACDELLLRVMTSGFCDGNGNMYRPHVVRVVSDENILTEAVKPRSLKTLVRCYTEMAQPNWQKRRDEICRRLAAMEREVAALEYTLSANSQDVNRDNANTAHTFPESIQLAMSLVEKIQESQRLRLEMEKLDKAGVLVWQSSDGRTDRRECEEAVTCLEEIFLEEAEMVFATLSSTQRDVFKNAARRAPFHTVLIDEAGQSSEVAALQPLRFGAKQVVLVGDPQQLPATILSEAAKAAAMERSLFERLQRQGCPVKVLTVQYRMDPEIRSFPSRHFYLNKLEDAREVMTRTPVPYHTRRLLRQYVVFDVSHGQERRLQAGGSLSNYEEAEFAVCLFLELKRAMDEAATEAKKLLQPPPTFPTIAVITPYREQKALIQQTFQKICGGDSAKNISINTIDSYQGRQVDIVILSCVRAQTALISTQTGEGTDQISGKGKRPEDQVPNNEIGLGFVNDVRRMNVAITRARRSLWILGAIETLQSNRHWMALIKDAEKRGCLEKDAHARQLFPHVWMHVQERQQQNKRQHLEAPPASSAIPQPVRHERKPTTYFDEIYTNRSVSSEVTQPNSGASAKQLSAPARKRKGRHQGIVPHSKKNKRNRREKSTLPSWHDEKR